MNEPLLTPTLIASVLILGLYLLARTQQARAIAILIIMAIGITAAFFTFEYSAQKEAIAGIEARFGQAGLDVDRYGGLEMRSLAYLQRTDSLIAARNMQGDTASASAYARDLAVLKAAFAMLQDSLHREIAHRELDMSLQGQIIRVHLQTDVTFETGRAILSPIGEQTLRRARKGLVEAMEQLPGHTIRIEGHADSQPLAVEFYFEDYDRYALDFTNWELSTLRAVSAARFLQEELHLPADRLQVVGWSEYHPRASNRTAAGRARNRRIDLVIAPAPQPETQPLPSSAS
jgi:flagellar motor protein MotB